MVKKYSVSEWLILNPNSELAAIGDTMGVIN